MQKVSSIQRIIFVFFLLFIGNFPFLAIQDWLNPSVLQVFLIGGSLFCLVYQVIPAPQKGLTFRLQTLRGGYELLRGGSVAWVLEVPILILYGIFLESSAEKILMISFCGIMTFVLTAISVYNGVLRVVFSAKQLHFGWKLLLLLTVWIPFWDLFLMWKACRVAEQEFAVEAELQWKDHQRVENEICKTKYPIVLVHGIFFRDWQLVNYWGRIPYELIKNGASVFYGNQESALSVSESAEEVKRHILDAMEKTGAEKVNIIAHSKGGLDTRYAISCLGMAEQVASLTTINTPHKGCLWAEKAMQQMPKRLLRWISQKYNAIFQRLGDQRPDFYRAVLDLTQSRCKKLNEQMPDAPSVYYQSVTSVMRGRKSAGFPLNLVYPLVAKWDGPNDGLVSVPSSRWGKFLGVQHAAGKRGISHADMIDLSQENIPGFSVREFYISLVSDLKKMGY